MPPRSRQQNLVLPMRIWDLPTRLFHWLVVLLLPALYVTETTHRFDLHKPLGYTMLGLLVFRVIWGFVGSETARFNHFLGNPLSGLRHVAHLGRREPDTEIGHNAAGGWFVLLMLLLLAVQVGSGLTTRGRNGQPLGPLAKYVDLGRLPNEIHGFNFDLILIAVAVHVLAIIAYAVFKRHDLTRAMVTGKKRLPASMRAPRMASPALAAGVVAIAALVAWAVVTQF